MKELDVAESCGRLV